MFKQTVVKFAPLSKATRKDKRLNAKQWITKEIYKSLKKNRLFAKIHTVGNTTLIN